MLVRLHMLFNVMIIMIIMGWLTLLYKFFVNPQLFAEFIIITYTIQMLAASQAKPEATALYL